MLLGVEAEYVAGREAKLEQVLSAWPFEVVVLGIHEVDGFVFDDPALRGDPRWDDPDALLAAYYRTARRAAEWGLFDILAHLDYIGLWGHRPGPAAQTEIDAALDALAACGAAIELNTDRFTDPAGVMYPSVEILRAARARGIPLTIDSDAHEVEHVGRAWDEGVAHARAAGCSRRRCASRTGCSCRCRRPDPGGPPLRARTAPAATTTAAAGAFRSIVAPR